MTAAYVFQTLRQMILTLTRRVSTLESTGGSGITQLTGDVTAGPGSGSQAATIANDAVTNAKLANMAANTIKGRANGAGTGDPQDLTANQVSTILDGATDPFLRTSAGSSYTDEQAQDAVGNILDDGGDIDFTYDDATPKITAAVKNDAVTYAKIQNVAANSYLGRAANSSGDVSEVALSASQLAGRGSSGDLAAIALGSGLSMSGTTLSATASGGSGSSYVLLEQHTASSSATLDFTAWYSSSYDEYVISGIGTIPATDGTNLFMTVSTNGGSSYSASNYKYGIAYYGTGGTGGNASTNVGTQGILIGGTAENTTSTGAFSFTIRMWNPGSTSRVKVFRFETCFQANTDGNYYIWQGVGVWADASNDIDALRFAFNSGNIAEGTIRIYGIAKS